MTKKKSTKRALISSLLVLAMCFTMLAGTTFAWFTDSVTSGSNIIKSGKLDVDLLIKAKGDADYVSVETNPTKVAFDYELWEPGYTTYAAAKVVNKGNLALKYDLKIATTGQLSALAEVIDVYTGDTVPADRDLSGMTKVGTLDQFITGSIASGSLLAGVESDPFVIALQMQTTAGNEYQNLELGAFSFQLIATQYTYEADSFNDQYDANAGYTVSASAATAAELTTAIDNAHAGDVIEITADITGSTVSLPDGVTILGNGHVLDASITGNKNVKLVNVNSKLVKATNFTGTLEFDGGTLSTADEDNGTDGSAPFSYLSGNTGDGTFIFKNMEVTAGATKGIKISGAKEVVIEGCVFDAEKISQSASGRIYDLRSMSMIDIQERNEDAPMKVTIKDCTFIGAPQGKLHQGFADSDTAAAIKLKAEVQGFSSVTITGNTFTNCYRDIAVGTNLLIEGSHNYYTNGKTVTELKLASNNVANTAVWNISGNTTTATSATKGYCVAKNDNAAYADTTIGAIIDGAAVYNTYKTNVLDAQHANGEDAPSVIAYLNTLTA